MFCLFKDSSICLFNCEFEGKTKLICTVVPRVLPRQHCQESLWLAYWFTRESPLINVYEMLRNEEVSRGSVNNNVSANALNDPMVSSKTETLPMCLDAAQCSIVSSLSIE